MTGANPDGPLWPSTPYSDWAGTCTALHLWSQIVGKYRLARTPWVDHSWHATLYVLPRGLTTGPVPHGGGSIALTVELCDHPLIAEPRVRPCQLPASQRRPGARRLLSAAPPAACSTPDRPEEPMRHTIPGLHHVTAISGPPQSNVDFYAGRLGQRLVKKTVNFDAPDTYHLYYGDRAGTPGTLTTFFPFADAGPGRAGPGMASALAYAVPPGGLDAWMGRLAEDAVDFDGPLTRLGERMIALPDPDGLRVELIETEGAPEGPAAGLHSVTLWLADPSRTARVFTDLFGYAEAGAETLEGTERLRFRAPAGGRGAVVDLLRSDAPSIGRQGTGTIHHVAFRAESPEVQREWRARIAAFGLDVTPVIDRQYFEAIYFREPGGVLFEIATDPPGFATDEAPEALGTALKLPRRYESRRAEIERVLPPIRVPA